MPVVPVDRTRKNYGCSRPNCEKTFKRPYDLERHERTHLRYNERPFLCPVVDCDFRSNQKGGVKCHFDSMHAGVRLPCGEPGCTKTFSDPSSRSKHRQKSHGTAGRSQVRKRSHKRKHSAAYPVSVHARVARHVEEHSRQDAKDILNQFATFAIQASGTSDTASPTSDEPPSDPDTGPSTSHGASSAPSSSVYRPNYTLQPSHCELPGVFHRANDVPTDGWSFDNIHQIEHQQAYDANPESALTAWGYYSDPSVLSRP